VSAGVVTVTVLLSGESTIRPPTISWARTASRYVVRGLSVASPVVVKLQPTRFPVAGASSSSMP